jgi:hypothetical protein
MKEKIRAVYLMIDQKVPFVGNVIRRFYFNRGFINTIKKRISGKGNKIIYGHSILSKVTFDIKAMIILSISGIVDPQWGTFFVREIVTKSIGSGCRFHGVDHSGLKTMMDVCKLEQVLRLRSTPCSDRARIKIIIGQNCMFANDIDIRTGDSHSIIERATGLRINVGGNINIGNHVWVAAHSIILKGVSIADDCVVGTGAVVVKSIEEPGVIVAGNPATIIKRNITWSRRRSGVLD